MHTMRTANGSGRVIAPSLSRKAWRPRATCRLASPLGELLLLRPVGEHREELEAPAPTRLEQQMAPVRSPRSAFVAAGSGREPSKVRAVGVHRPDVVIALT